MHFIRIEIRPPFWHCLDKNIIIKSLCRNVTEFSANTFKGCSNLKTVNVGNDVTSIPADAFKNFKKLTTVKMGTGVKTIGKNAKFKKN